MKIKKIHKAIEDITPEIAAQILGLSANDPTVALYQGIQFFEKNQAQDALEKFIFAAQHYQLHAIPYIEELLKSKACIIDAATQEKLDKISEWSPWLADVRVAHKEFLFTSRTCIKLHMPGTKKNEQKEHLRLVKDFMRNTENCGHLNYHQYFHETKADKKLLILTSAANNGHLLAVAYFAQGAQAASNATDYFKIICLLRYHQAHPQKTFGERLFYAALSLSEPVGKKCLHFEALRLGVTQSFHLVAKLYCMDNRDFAAAGPLIALGLRLEDPYSRSLTASFADHLKQIKLQNFQLTTEAIVHYLSLNLIQDFQIADHPLQDSASIKTSILTACANSISKIMQMNIVAPEHYITSGLFARFVEVVNKAGDLTQEHIVIMANMISAICARIASISASVEDQISFKQCGIKHIEIVYNKSLTVNYLLDAFYLKKEVFEIQHKHKMLTADKKLIQLEELHRDIQKIEGLFKTMQADAKFIEYSADVYIHLSKTFAKSSYKQHYAKFLLSAAEIKIAKYVVILARAYTHGNREFPLDPFKARQLIFSLPEEHAYLREAISILIFSYLHEPTPNTQMALDTAFAYLNRFPDLNLLLGDLFADGYLGIEVNTEQALLYYQNAVERNLDEGYLGLALEKLDSYPNAKDERSQIEIRQQTLEYLNRAFKSGSRDAAYFLGKIYNLGNLGLAKDFVKAQHYFIEANKSDQPYAKAMLAMIAAGYQGEYPYSLNHELIRQVSLKESGVVDLQAAAMFEYGIVNLYYDPQLGCKYLVKAAQYNDLNAQYLIASLQVIIDLQFCNIVIDAIAKLNKENYRKLMDNDLPAGVISYIAQLFHFAKILSRYSLRGYTIDPEYVQIHLQELISALNVDLIQIEEHIKEHFPPEEIRKMRMLVAIQDSSTKSGNEECQHVTKSLLSNKNPQVNFRKKVRNLRDNDKISMKCFSDCLSAFFNSGTNISSAENKKAIKAGVHMHVPHGGEHNAHQNLEGGRRETARQTLKAIESELESQTSSPNSNFNI